GGTMDLTDGNTGTRQRGNAMEPQHAGVVLNIPELDQCVHCGLCLNHCPTYRVTQLEPESPRGRIHLVRAVAEGRIEPLDPARGTPNERFADHIYLCLMCRACETACPSGVQYGRIAEAAREVLGPPGSPLFRRLARLAFTEVFPSPRRLRWIFSALRLYQRSGLQWVIRRVLPRRLREMDALLPAVPSRFFAPGADVMPAIGTRRARVALLSGCVMSTLFGDVNDSPVWPDRDDGDVSGSLSPRPRAEGARATAPAAGRNSRAASGGDGGGGPLLWERRNLQHHAPGDVPRAVDRKNGGRRPHRRGG